MYSPMYLPALTFASSPAFRPSLRPVAGVFPLFGTCPTAPSCVYPHPKSGKPIDNDVYYLIRSTPKVFLHDHFNGSMSDALIVEARIREMAKGLKKYIRRDLSRAQVRADYRLIRAREFQKDLPSSQLQMYQREDQLQISETPFTNGNGNKNDVFGGHQDDSGLGRYRIAYDKIPKLIKAPHHAFIGALLYTHQMANHNVRYFELRTNPLAKQETPSIEKLRRLLQQELEHTYLHYEAINDAIRCNSSPPDMLVKAIRHHLGDIPKTTINQAYRQAKHRYGRKVTLHHVTVALKDHLKVTPEDLIHAIQLGIDHARTELQKTRKHIDYGLILLAYRHQSLEEALNVANIAIDLKKKGYPIAGVDLGGSEQPQGCEVTKFKAFFDRIHDYNRSVSSEKRIGITIHAGETRRSGELQGWESIKKSVELGLRPETPFRIGHGIEIMKESQILQDAFQAFLKDPKGWEKTYPRQKILDNSPTLAALIQYGVGLEMCLKSNVHTQIVPYHDVHPALFLSRLGAKVSINTDNMVIDNTDPTNEFVKLYKYQNAFHADRKRMVLDALDTAFIFDSQKRRRIQEDTLKLFDYIERHTNTRLAMIKEQNNGVEPSPFQVFRMEFSNALSALWSAMTQYTRKKID